MPNKDYDNFVARMGSFDEIFEDMDLNRLFSPEKYLKVTKVSDITDDIRKASSEKLKVYNSKGRDWVQKELYDD